MCNLPNDFVHLNSCNSHFSDRAPEGNPRSDSPLRRCKHFAVWLSSCPTSESIFQDHVGCCWDLDSTEKWHILSVWPFLLFPLPLPHLITGVSYIPQILPPQSPASLFSSFLLHSQVSTFPQLPTCGGNHTFYQKSKKKIFVNLHWACGMY